MPTRILSRTKPMPPIVTPTACLGAAEGLCLVALAVPQAHSREGALLLLAGLVVFAGIARASRAGSPHRVRAARSASVFLVFSPALVFPTAVPFLLSLCALLLWWLGTEGTQEDSNAQGSAHSLASTRPELLADLGLPPVARGAAPARAVFPWRGAALGALPAALLAVPAVFPPAAHTCAAISVFACTIASWEQVFLAFHISRSPRT